MSTGKQIAGGCVLAALMGLAGGPASAGETAARGADINIIDGDDRTIYEYYRGGILLQIKVVPNFGPAYYLVPANDAQAPNDLRQAGTLVPRWIVHEFERGAPKKGGRGGPKKD